MAHSLHSQILQSVYCCMYSMISVVRLRRCNWMRVMSHCISDFKHFINCSLNIYSLSRVFMNLPIIGALQMDLLKLMYALEIIDKIMITGHSIDARWSILYHTALYWYSSEVNWDEGEVKQIQKIVCKFIDSVHVSILTITMTAHKGYSRYRRIILP